MLTRVFFTCFIIPYLLGCGSNSKKKDEFFNQAVQLHDQSVELYKEVNATRDSLMSMLDHYTELQALLEKTTEPQIWAWKARDFEHKFTYFTLLKQLPSTNPREGILEIDSLLTSWQETFSEVPGYEDYPKHHPNHNHGPSLIKDLRMEDVRNFQSDQLNDLKVIGEKSKAYIGYYHIILTTKEELKELHEK